jgi:DHA2 family multidrug resistance protein-like MFS transporter
MKKETSLKALLWIVSAGFFMQTLDTTIINTALPSIASSLNENALDLQPVIVAYSLTMAMLTPASGWLADRFGTRRLYFAAILVFAIGSLLCAMSHTLTQLIAARVLQGIGGSMLLPIGRLALLRSYPALLYIAAITSASIAGQTGPLIGPVLGGWLVEAISWHWIFLINLPISLIGCAAVLIFLPREDGLPHAIPRFDLAGFALLSTCMVTFSLGLDGVSGNKSWLWGAGMLGASAVLVAAYIQWAKLKADPLFSLSLFKQRTFALGLIGNLIARIGGNAIMFLMPLLFQLELGMSALQAGMMMLPTAIAAVGIKRFIVPLVKTYGYSKFLTFNTLLVAITTVAFATISTSLPIWVIVLQLGLFGAFNSMQNGAMNSVTLKDLSLRDASSGNSLYSMAQMLAVGLGVTIVGHMVRSDAGVPRDLRAAGPDYGGFGRRVRFDETESEQRHIQPGHGRHGRLRLRFNRCNRRRQRSQQIGYAQADRRQQFRQGLFIGIRQQAVGARHEQGARQRRIHDAARHQAAAAQLGISQAVWQDARHRMIGNQYLQRLHRLHLKGDARNEFARRRGGLDDFAHAVQPDRRTQIGLQGFRQCDLVDDIPGRAHRPRGTRLGRGHEQQFFTQPWRALQSLHFRNIVRQQHVQFTALECFE